MAHGTARQLNLAYAILIALALSGVVLAAWGAALPAAGAGILLLAVLKARCVIIDFMGLGDASPALRIGLIAWPVAFALAGLGKIALSAVLAG